MFTRNIAAVALSALTVVSATSSNWTINVNEVDVGTRNTWCTAQLNSCDSLCSPPSANTCDFSTLDYTCTCADGSDPKLGEYKSTIEFFTCQQAFQDCNLAHVGDASGQKNCIDTIQDNCGTKDPTEKASSGGSGSSDSSSTASAGPTQTGSGSSPASQTPKSSDKPASAGVSLSAFQYFGNGAAALAIAAVAYMM